VVPERKQPLKKPAGTPSPLPPETARGVHTARRRSKPTPFCPAPFWAKLRTKEQNRRRPRGGSGQKEGAENPGPKTTALGPRTGIRGLGPLFLTLLQNGGRSGPSRFPGRMTPHPREEAPRDRSGLLVLFGFSPPRGASLGPQLWAGFLAESSGFSRRRWTPDFSSPGFPFWPGFCRNKGQEHGES
jgi:hypothetical protein